MPPHFMRPVLRAIPHPMMTDWDMPDCHDAADNLYNPLVRCRAPPSPHKTLGCSVRADPFAVC